MLYDLHAERNATFYYTMLCYSISYYNILYCAILYRNVQCCGVNAGMATSFTCATHLQSRKSGYPIHCSFFKGDGHLLNLSQGVAIPSRFSFWRMGGHILHVLYYSALYCINNNIRCYNVLYYIILYNMMVYDIILYYIIRLYYVVYYTITTCTVVLL